MPFADQPWLFLLLLPVLLLFGWRAWVMLEGAAPLVRSTGAILSAVVPFPVFIIVAVYYYAARRRAARR